MKLLLPAIDPNTLPIGLVAPGLDNNLYVVNQKRCWSLFKHAQVKYVYHDGKHVEVQSVLPELDFTEFPKLKVDEPNDNLAVLEEEPIPAVKRGRPKTHIQKRKSRKPSLYNEFVKSQMVQFKHISNSREKMKLIADMWKSHNH
jgi:hypothetical protein